MYVKGHLPTYLPYHTYLGCSSFWCRSLRGGRGRWLGEREEGLRRGSSLSTMSKEGEEEMGCEVRVVSR